VCICELLLATRPDYFLVASSVVGLWLCSCRLVHVAVGLCARGHAARCAPCRVPETRAVNMVCALTHRLIPFVVFIGDWVISILRRRRRSGCAHVLDDAL
jgi:hypothetical protein